MIYTVVVGGLAFAGLWVLAFWFYRDYRVDAFREDVFRIRGDLFDFAAAGGIDFAHPAYSLLRDMCNGYIRFAHRMTLSSAVVVAAGIRPEDEAWLDNHGFHSRWEATKRGLNGATLTRLEDFKSQVEEAVVKQLVVGSPILVATVVPAVSFLVVLWLQVRLISRFWDSAFGDHLDGTALAMGRAA